MELRSRGAFGPRSSHKLRRELVPIYRFHCEKIHREFVRHATKRDLATKREGISEGFRLQEKGGNKTISIVFINASLTDLE